MSKTVSANLLAELESEAPNICTCWKIERTDGTILSFTDWPISFLYGGQTYTPAGGYQRTATNQREGLAVDNLDVFGLIDSSYITEDDLLAGKYKNAKVWIFVVSPNNLTWGDLKLNYGTIGQIEVREGIFVAEFRSLTTKLAQSFGNKYSPYCRWQLGDSNCGIILEPDIWTASTAYAVGDIVRASVYDGRRYICSVAGTSNDTEGEPTWDTTITNTTTETDGVEWVCYNAYIKEATVTSLTSNFIFNASILGQADDWFKYGVLTWTSGDNSGISTDVKEFSSTQITLRKETPKDIQIGDEFKISTGCNHILKMPTDVKGSPYTGDCRVKFDNVINFGGEPELPNKDRISTTADSA